MGEYEQHAAATAEIVEPSPRLSTLGEWAIWYASNGFAVHPLKYHEKAPRTAHGVSEATTDIAQVRRWWSTWPDANIGVACGEASGGLLAIDIDVHPERDIDGFRTLNDWEREHGELPETLVSVSGSGGQHLLYRTGEPLACSKDDTPDHSVGVDIRANGGYIVVPPSVHPNGSSYEFEEWPWDMPIARADDNVLGFVRKVQALSSPSSGKGSQGMTPSTKTGFSLPADVHEGSRDDTLYRWACSMRADNVPKDLALEMMRIYNASHCHPPLPDKTVEQKVDSAYKHAPGKGSATQADVVLDMRGNPDICGRFGQNVLDFGYYVRGRLPWDRDGALRRWDDADEAYLFSYEQMRMGVKNRENVKGAFKIICAENRFNPIVDMLEGLPPWDGKRRAEFMLWALFGAALDPYTREASLVWMRGAVRRAYEPGCKFDYTIVLKGAQGIKKSMTGRRLAMREEFFCETVTDITSAKTTAEQTGGKWIVELGELSGLKGKELESVKAALTAQKVTVRPAYGHFPVDQPRSCVFLATTNEANFLTDPTGNRRFLPVECDVAEDRQGWEEAGSEQVREFISQAWAEVLAQYKDARSRTKDEDEFLKLYALMLSDEAEVLANELRDAATVEDTRVGVIQEWLDNCAAVKKTRVCTRMVAKLALGLDDEALERGKWVMKDIALMLDTNFPEWVRNPKKQRIDGYGVTRVWDYVPAEGGPEACGNASATA